jgi:hypothetical protein
MREGEGGTLGKLEETEFVAASEILQARLRTNHI